MNQIGVILVILLLLPASTFAVETGFSEDPQVLIAVPSSDWDEQALESIIDALHEYNVSFQIVSPDISSSLSGSDYNILPLDSIADEIPDNASLIIMGGVDSDSLLKSSVLLNETRKRIQIGVPVGALDYGILYLGEAGLLNGTRVASLQEADANNRLLASGAVIENTEGVIDDSIITAYGPGSVRNFAEVIIREVIAQEISDSIGIVYLGDTNEAATYIIPQRIQKPVITAVQNGTIVEEWNGEPFLTKTDEDIQIPVARGDWVLLVSPKNDVCVLYEQFTGFSIPYGTVMYVDNNKLGTKRDFSTNIVPVGEIFQDITFKDVYQTSPEYIESNRTLRNWTIEVNNTNVSVQETVALLYDDISISDPTWNNQNANVCIEGEEFGEGILDILQKRGDIETSIAYDEEELSGLGCYEILLNDDVKTGSTAYLTVYSNDGVIIQDKEILIP